MSESGQGMSTAELLMIQRDQFPELRHFGHPNLGRAALIIPEDDFDTPRLIEEADILKDFLVRYRRAIGGGAAVAANQIGIDRAMFAIFTGDGYESEDATIFCNPRIERSNGRQVYSEVCMSGVHLIGDVVRAYSLQLPYRTPEGDTHIYPAMGRKAVVAQHELDHIHGFACWQRYWPHSIVELTGGSSEISEIMEARLANQHIVRVAPPPPEA